MRKQRKGKYGFFEIDKKGKKIGLDANLVKKIWGEIFQVSREAQK